MIQLRRRAVDFSEIVPGFGAMTALALLAILQANSDRSTPISASIHSRGRTAKSGTGVTEITPVPKNLNFAFCLQSVRGLSVSFSFALTSRTSSCPANP